MSDQITDWLDEVQQRADAATKGPWGFQYWSEHPLPSGEYAESILYADDAFDGELVRGLDNEDGEFIAAARTDLPAAVSALRAVLAECDYLERVQAAHRVEVGQREVIRKVRAAISTALGVEVTE